MQAVTQQAKETMPKGAGLLYVRRVTDKNGNRLEVPVNMELPISEFQSDSSQTINKFNGSQKFAVAVAAAGVDAKITCKVLNINPHIANHLFFGEDAVQGSKTPTQQTISIPDGYTTNYKIKNVKTLHLGKFTGNTSVTIAGSAATMVSGKPTKSGQCSVAGGIYKFASLDKGKTCVITWTCVSGTTVVSTFKVPVKLQINLNAFNSVGVVVKKATATWTKDTYNPAGVAPAATHYQVSPSGVFVFESSDTGSLTITHKTDQVSLSSVIATLPAAGYKHIIDPPGVVNWESTSKVTLVSDSGTAMTGVAVGEELANNASPTSGEYDDSSIGVYAFAAADVGDVVKIEYVGDYISFKLEPPEDGEFLEMLSIVNGRKMPMNIVAVTSPISLNNNECAVDDAGNIYIDGSNFGETWVATYLCTDPTGSGYVVKNSKMGEGCELELTASVTGNGVRYTWTSMVGYCNGEKPGATKMDGFADATAYEFTLRSHEFVDGDGVSTDIVFERYYSEDLA